MKAFFLQALAVIGVALTCDPAFAQSTVAVPVVRGRVVVANPESRVMTVSIGPASTPITFYGMERARIERTGGRLATLAELRPGTEVIVHYVTQEGRWYPQRILIPDANLVVPAAPLSPAESKALGSEAANDRDITTNPGVKARIDNDITTKPGQKDPADRDITKKGN
jgi:hypothetical protein